MALDDLKDAWAAHGAMLERSLAIDQRLLRALLLRKVRSALTPYVIGRAVEIGIGVGMCALALRVLIAHAGEPLYGTVVGMVAGFAAFMTARSVALLVGTLSIDYGRPVTAIQRDLERLRRAEYRALKWALLGGVVLWLPVALVLAEALTGLPWLTRVEVRWLAANLAIGLVVLEIGHRLSRRHVERADLGPRARRLVDGLSGRGLRTAAAHLAELAEFEGDRGRSPKT
jgi:hypothetical protein